MIVVALELGRDRAAGIDLGDELAAALADQQCGHAGQVAVGQLVGLVHAGLS